MKLYQRKLSSAQAAACESAIHPRCTCRCGGALHGVAHQKFQEIEEDVIARQGSITDDQVADIIEFLKEE
jgi:hypothetical protein